MASIQDIAQVLTQTSLPELTRLDASATIEVYVLTRMAELQSMQPIPKEDDADFDNESENDDVIVRVPKTALGFRHTRKSSYRSIGGSSKNDITFELTLEYGPNRFTKVDLDLDEMLVHEQETIPQIIEDRRQQKSVVFDNSAHVFYTRKIDRSTWQEAHFMAPITGAVLSKVLNFVVEYPVLHPYYQPFEVVRNAQDYENENEGSQESDSYTIEIPSSSADDFVWNVITFLADLYVNVNPVLIPSRYYTRIFVSEKPSRITDDASQSRFATDFFDRTYSCIMNAITEDISNTEDPLDRYTSSMPSSIPTYGPSSGKAQEPSSQPTNKKETRPNSQQDDSFYPTQSPKTLSLGNGTRVLVSDYQSSYVNMKTAHVLPCLLEPISNSKLAINNTAYIFEKESQYWELQLTYPFVTATTDTGLLPIAKPAQNGVAQPIDWILALAIVLGFIVGIFAIMRNAGICYRRTNSQRQDGISLTTIGSNKSDDEGLMMIPTSLEEESREEYEHCVTARVSSTKFIPISLPIEERVLHTHSSQRYGKLIFGHTEHASRSSPNITASNLSS